MCVIVYWFGVCVFKVRYFKFIVELFIFILILFILFWILFIFIFKGIKGGNVWE